MSGPLEGVKVIVLQSFFTRAEKVNQLLNASEAIRALEMYRIQKMKRKGRNIAVGFSLCSPYSIRSEAHVS